MLKRPSAVAFAIAFVLVLPACSKQAAPPSPGDSAVTTTAGAAPTKSVAQDAGAIADLIQAAVPQIAARVTITEDNDANNLIGRPGQYDQAVFLADSRLGCEGPGYNELSIDCGAKIERWPTPEDAQGRIDDIQAKLKAYGLGAEWDYLVGRVVVRVSGTLKPSEAAAYEAAVRA